MITMHALHIFMRASRASLLTLISASLMLGCTVWFGTRPALEQAQARADESGRLLARASQRDAVTRERDRARAELIATRRDALAVLRTIPARADQAHLMRLLTVGAAPDVGTQTIVAGDPLPASLATDSPYFAVPVTVEMTASFARVMELLQRAENDVRLVRPIRVEIARIVEEGRAGKPQPSPTNIPLVQARLEFDAVYGVAQSVREGETP